MVRRRHGNAPPGNQLCLFYSDFHAFQFSSIAFLKVIALWIVSRDFFVRCDDYFIMRLCVRILEEKEKAKLGYPVLKAFHCQVNEYHGHQNYFMTTHPNYSRARNTHHPTFSRFNCLQILLFIIYNSSTHLYILWWCVLRKRFLMWQQVVILLNSCKFWLWR